MQKMYEEIKKEIQNNKKIYILYDKISTKLKDDLLFKVVEDINIIKGYLKVLILNADGYLEKEIKKIDDKMIMSLNIHEDVYKMINENSLKFDYYIFDNIRDHYSTIIHALNSREGILTIELEDDNPGDSQLHKMHNLIENDIRMDKYDIMIKDQQLRIFLLRNNKLF